MIKSVQIVNFKSFADSQVIVLPRFLVLVGDNAAGKTNFCDALKFTQDVLDEGVEKAFLKERRGDFTQIVHRRNPENQMKFRFEFGDIGDTWNLVYEFSLGLPGKRGTPQILSESLEGKLKNQKGPRTEYLSRNANTSKAHNALSGKPNKQENWGVEPGLLQISRLTDAERFPAIVRVREELISLLVLRPDPESLRQSVTIRTEAELGEDGFGLAAILDSVEPDVLISLSDILAEGDRLTRSIRTIAAEPGKKVIGIQEKDEKEPFYPDQLSDGTLRLLTILAAIQGVQKGGKILIVEEPENGLHFSRLSRLLDISRERVQKDETAQIILTSHAIPLLHQLNREEIKAIVRGQTGESLVLEPPDEEKWKRFRDQAGLSMGDLYTTGLWPRISKQRSQN